jgi:CDGSH-type Zn-finger protein
MPAMCHCHKSRKYPYCDGSHKGNKGTLKDEPQIEDKIQDFIFDARIVTTKSATEEETI